MNTTIVNAAEYRALPLAMLTESATNPRRIFEDAALKELAASIRTQGVLSPLLVRPVNEQGFEIVAGARRYRPRRWPRRRPFPSVSQRQMRSDVLIGTISLASIR